MNRILETPRRTLAFTKGSGKRLDEFDKRNAMIYYITYVIFKINMLISKFGIKYCREKGRSRNIS